jgi:hypothetical protein
MTALPCLSTRTFVCTRLDEDEMFDPHDVEELKDRLAHSFEVAMYHPSAVKISEAFSDLSGLE